MLVPNAREDSLQDAAFLFCDYTNFLSLWQRTTQDEAALAFMQRSQKLLQSIREYNAACTGSAKRLAIVHCCVGDTIKHPEEFVSDSANKYYQLFEALLKRKQHSFATDFTPIENELVISRPRASPFKDTHLFEYLCTNGFKRLYICGLTISESILAAVYDCSNFDVEGRVVQDAVFQPLDRQQGDLVLRNLIPRLADLADLAKLHHLLDMTKSNVNNRRQNNLTHILN